MKVKLRRIIAIILAVIMFAGSICTDNLLTKEVIAAETKKEIKGLLPKLEEKTLSEEMDELEEEIQQENEEPEVDIDFSVDFQIVGMVDTVKPEKIKVVLTVGGENIKEYNGELNNENKIHVENVILKEGTECGYCITDSESLYEYVDSTFFVEAEKDSYLIPVSATPAYRINGIEGEDKFEVGEIVDYNATIVGNEKWKKMITCSISNGNNDVSFNDNKNGTCRLKVNRLGNDEKSVDFNLSFEGPNSQSIGKRITVCKKRLDLSVNITPEDGLDWKKAATFTVSVNPVVKGIDINAYIKTNDSDEIVRQETIGTDHNGQSEFTVTSETWNKIGEYNKNLLFIYEIAPNGVYYSEKNNKAFTISKTDQLDFDITKDNDVNLTYGDTKMSIATINESGTDLGDNADYIVKSNMNDDFEIDNDKIYITPNSAGTRTISVTKRDTSGKYNDKTEEFVIDVAKKEISLVAVATDKVYDGNAEVDVTVSLNKDELVEGEIEKNTPINPVIVTGIAQSSEEGLDGKDAGTKNVIVSKEALKAFKLEEKYVKNYVVIQETELPAITVTIHKKKLSLNLCNKNTERGEYQIEYTQYLDLQNYNLTITGFIQGENQNIQDFKKPEIEIGELKKDNGGIILNCFNENVVQAKETTGNATKNYEFDFENQKKGSLVLLPHNIGDGKDFFEIDNIRSYKVYENKDSGDIFYGIKDNDRNPVAIFNMKNPSEQYNTDMSVTYTRILVKSPEDGNEELWQDITETGLEVDVSQDIVERQFKLMTDGNGETSEFSLIFIKDDKAPNTLITIEKAVSAYVFAKNVTFGRFKNAAYNARIDVEDKNPASGIKEWSYCVVSTNKDVIIDDNDDINSDEFKKKFRTYRFKNGDGLSEEFRLGVGESEDIVAGNYVVFVKVEDNVGNSSLYGSNGVVVDNIPLEPIEINYDNNLSFNSIDGNDYFSGDVTLKVNIKENTADYVFSGIDIVTYAIEREKANENEQLLYSWKKEHGEEYEEGVLDTTLENLKNYSEVENQIIVGKSEESQCIKVNVRAKDFADNQSEQSKSFIIDPKAPEVQNIIISDGYKGKYYYNNDIELKTIIKERFLDTNNDVKYNITIDKEDGTEPSVQTISLKQLMDGYENIKAELISDSGEEKKDERTFIVKLIVSNSQEAKYKLSTTVADKAGNTVTSNDVEFVIDTTAPKVDINYLGYGNGGIDVKPGKSSKNPAYLNEEFTGFTPEVLISDCHFNKKDTKYQVSKNEGKFESREFYFTGNEWRTYWYYNDDGRYIFKFTCVDLAGNEAIVNGNSLSTYGVDYITLDKTKPEGEITIWGKTKNVNGENEETWNWTSFIKSITFKHFSFTKIEVSFKANDETAGIDRIWYYIASSEYEESSELDSSGLKLDDNANWIEYTKGTKVTVPKNNRYYVVYEKVRDKAGNEKLFSSNNVVTDNKSPDPNISVVPSKPSWKKGVYKAADNPSFDIAVEEPENGAYAGIKSITYVFKNGKTNYTSQVYTLKTFEKGTHVQKLNTTRVRIGNLEKYYSNDVWVEVTVSDWAGNSFKKESEHIKIDTKAPIVKFSFDKSDAQNGKYYKNDKRLTITVDERNFDSIYKPKVTSSAGGGYNVSEWTHNGEIHTCVINFSGDSDYSVTFDCYDLAGNKSNTEKLDEFTVDKTNPKIAVSYDNNSSTNGKYYKSERTATITITEHNFDASNVKVITTANLTGKSVAVPMVSGWSSNGDMHTASIHYSEDGDYTFEVSSTDQAGNASDPYAKESFTVDKTNPEIKIEGVEDKSANKGKIAPVITLKDVNYDANTTEVTLTGVNRGRVDVNKMISRTSDGNGETINIANLAKDMDDYYTLTVKTTDKAGNSFEKSIHYSANRNGSVYTFNNYTKNLLEKGYTNNPEDLVIEEMNVDTLEFVELKYSRDGKVVTLKENEDYTVKKEGGDGRVIYTYSINAKCFEEEGEYSVNIHSEDRAKNEATNTAKDSIIKFVVDKTSPTLIVTNLENNGRYKENSHTFDVSAMDNAYLTKVEYYLDDQLMHTYEGKELQDTNGEFEIAIQSKNQYQKVKLAAYDAAENPASEDEYRVLVTSSAFVQFYMNKPLFYGVILIILAAAGILVLIVIKRKRDEEKKIKLH